MKKVLVAGAALMLAGSANAGVNISGDARVTYVGMGDYLRNETGTNGYADYFESRVGLNFEAKKDEGASVNARLYFDDYGFEDDVVWNGHETQSVTADYAYMTVPLANGWSIKAGRLPLSFSPFFSYDIRATRVYAIYSSGNFAFKPFVGVKKEFAGNALDDWDDNDYMQYGVVASTKLPNGWTLKGYGRYDDDQKERDSSHRLVTINGTDELGNPITMQVPEAHATGGLRDVGGHNVVPEANFGSTLTPHTDRSGFVGSVHLNNSGAPNCPLGFEAEVAYKGADVQGTEDDGIGGYLLLSSKMGAFTPAVLGGITQNGFVADNDFGFVMVGGNESTTVVNVGNGNGDLWFAAFVTNYAISDRLSLTGNVLYADYDNNSPAISDAIEVSGVASYALSSGASLSYKAGYLAVNMDDENANDDAYFGHLVRLDLEF